MTVTVSDPFVLNKTSGSGSEKGSFGEGICSEKPISGDSREFRDSRDSREPPDSGK